MKLLKSTLTLALLAALPLCAKATGPSGTGGGNLQEADFVTTAREIYAELAQQPARTKEVLGIDPNDYLVELEQIPVQCSFGPITVTMREQNKQAFFVAESKSIFLDCDQYDKIKNAGSTKKVIIFHEYMRPLVQEDSEYRVSSKLTSLLRELNIVTNLDEVPFTATHSDACPKVKFPESLMGSLSYALDLKKIDDKAFDSYCGYNHDKTKVLARLKAVGAIEMLRRAVLAKTNFLTENVGEVVAWDWNQIDVASDENFPSRYQNRTGEISQLSSNFRLLIHGKGNYRGSYNMDAQISVFESNERSHVTTNGLDSADVLTSFRVERGGVGVTRVEDKFKVWMPELLDYKKNDGALLNYKVRYKKTEDGQLTSEILGFKK